MPTTTPTPRPQPQQPIPERAQVVFKGELFTVYQWEQEMFDGSTATFERIKRPDTVNIIAVDTEGHILLVDEQQPGMEPFIDVCGGRIDPGEDALETAHRELLEETGYKAASMELWKATQPAGTKIDWAVYHFIARGCERAGIQQLDAGERIEVLPSSFDEFWEVLYDPRFRSTDLANLLIREARDQESFKRLRTLILGE